eukprot:12415144-Karenia_brevis.AAC.1
MTPCTPTLGVTPTTPMPYPIRNVDPLPARPSTIRGVTRPASREPTPEPKRQVPRSAPQMGVHQNPAQ